MIKFKWVYKNSNCDNILKVDKWYWTIKTDNKTEHVKDANIHIKKVYLCLNFVGVQVLGGGDKSFKGWGN